MVGQSLNIGLSGKEISCFVRYLTFNIVLTRAHQWASKFLSHITYLFASICDLTFCTVLFYKNINRKIYRQIFTFHTTRT